MKKVFRELARFRGELDQYHSEMIETMQRHHNQLMSRLDDLIDALDEAFGEVDERLMSLEQKAG